MSTNAGDPLEAIEVAKAHQPSAAAAIAHNDTEKKGLHETDEAMLPSEKGSMTAAPLYDDGRHVDHPTDEELVTLRRVSGKVPWTAYTIAFVELCERFSYYGTTAVCK